MDGRGVFGTTARDEKSEVLLSNFKQMFYYKDYLFWL